MAENCAFPNCTRLAEKSGYCVGHSKWAGNSSTPKEPQKPIAKRSEKMEDTVKELKKAYALFLAKPENKTCKVKAKGCTTIATVVHHVRGRGANVLNEKDWLPSCAQCNIEIENKDADARAAGTKKSRLAKT